jgi:hypothetical protein
MAYDQALAARVRDLLSARADVVEKRLMGGRCFLVAGAMCCSVSGKGGLLIRVGPDAHARAMGEPNVQAMKMGNRIVRGFVRVAPEGYRKGRQLRRWVMRGL